MNNKGQAFVENYVTIMITVIVIAIGCVFLWGFMVGLPLMSDLVGTGTSSIRDLSSSVNDVNINNSMQIATTPVLNVLGDFQFALYLFFFGLFVGFCVLCYYARSYPFMLFVWIALMTVMTLMGVYLSSAYTDMLVDTYTSSVMIQWGTVNWILTNLPMVFVAIGLIGGAIMFLLIPKEADAEQMQL